VKREPDADDGRSFLASLTPAGRARLAEARVTHDAVIDELLGARLSEPEVEALDRIMGRALRPDAAAYRARSSHRADPARDDASAMTGTVPERGVPGDSPPRASRDA
jgi:hypothetical protein